MAVLFIFLLISPIFSLFVVLYVFYQSFTEPSLSFFVLTSSFLFTGFDFISIFFLGNHLSPSPLTPQRWMSRVGRVEVA